MKKEKQIYSAPVIEIITFDAEDVITTSSLSDPTLRFDDIWGNGE